MWLDLLAVCPFNEQRAPSWLRILTLDYRACSSADSLMARGGGWWGGGAVFWRAVMVTPRPAHYPAAASVQHPWLDRRTAQFSS